MECIIDSENDIRCNAQILISSFVYVISVIVSVARQHIVFDRICTSPNLIDVKISSGYSLMNFHYRLMFLVKFLILGKIAIFPNNLHKKSW